MGYSYVPDGPLERMQRHAVAELREWTLSKEVEEKRLASATRMKQHWTDELASIEAELKKREERA